MLTFLLYIFARLVCLTQRPTKSTRSGRGDEGVTKDHYENKLPEIALAGLKALEAKSHNEEKQ
jgi:hypothetical protein